jgi:hypothetical protein
VTAHLLNRAAMNIVIIRFATLSSLGASLYAWPGFYFIIFDAQNFIKLKTNKYAQSKPG